MNAALHVVATPIVNNSILRSDVGLDATDVRGAFCYSSNADFLLRYLAEHSIAPKNIEE